MNIRFLVLILISILLMGCASDDKTDAATGPSEYDRSSVLVQIKADKAYGRGETGRNQIVSLYVALDPAASNGYDAAYGGLAGSVNPVFVDGYDADTGDTDDIGECTSVACSSASASQLNSHNFNTIVGRKDGLGFHGVAYDAQLKIINKSGADDTKISAAIEAGGTTADETIAAMVNSFVDGKAEDNGGNYYYTPDLKVSTTERDAWKKVADAETVIVSNAGRNGANSVNGLVPNWKGADAATNRDNKDVNSAGTIKAETLYSGAAYANIASFTTDVIDGDFKGKWIVAVGVDENNLILPLNNGCGDAAQYCLSVPERTQPDNLGRPTINLPEYTLAGAIAVVRSAYTLTAEEAVRLLLGTADYIDSVDGLDATYSTTDGHYNPIYGHGLLDLDAATSLSAADAVDASVLKPSSLDVSWGDTQLTLSSHFGGQLDSVKLGVQDKYRRHFVLEAQNTTHEPVGIGLDDYMAGLLGDDVQSEKLGAQAQANYSNTGEQNWMNLEYVSGKTTSKIAFQDSYKANPLNDMGETFSLRANHIRPASNNIGMMDVDYALSKSLTLSSYAARGEYDTGYKFDELGTDIDLRHKKSTLNLGLGHLREHEQFLGTNTTGAYALREPAVSQFTDVTYGHDVGEKFNLYANYIQYKTDVDMGYQDFADIDGLQADQYQIGFKGKNILSDDDGLNVALITKLGVTDGALTQNTVMGYTQAGGFNNVTQSYDLAVSERHQQFEITYQGRLYQNADKVSALQDNRFFTTIRVDQNLNHEEGLGQTEIIGGINARF